MVSVAQFAYQGLPIQGLLRIAKLPAYMHVVLVRKRPFRARPLQLLKLPWIQPWRSFGVKMCFRIHESIAWFAEELADSVPSAASLITDASRSAQALSNDLAVLTIKNGFMVFAS